MGELASQLAGRVSGLSRVLLPVAAVPFVVAGFGRLDFAAAYTRPPSVYNRDFSQDYLLARAIVGRVDPTLPLHALASRFDLPIDYSLQLAPTPHPPTVGLLLSPLALVDLPTAAAIWLAVSVLCLLASVVLLARLIDLPLQAWQVGAIVMALLSWFPVFWGLNVGQVGILLLPLTAGAVISLKVGRPGLAGVLLGLTMLVKEIMWPVLLLFLVARNWRALVASLFTTAAGYLAALLVVGPAAMARYFLTVPSVVTAQFEPVWVNLSLFSVGWRVFGGVRNWAGKLTMSPLIDAPWLVTPASIAVVAAALIWALLQVRRARSSVTGATVMVCVSILVSPITWAHYLVLLTIPAALVGDRLARQGRHLRQTALLAFALLLTVPAYDGTGIVAQLQPLWPLPFAYSLLGMLPTLSTALIAWLVLATDREPGPSSS